MPPASPGAGGASALERSRGQAPAARPRSAHPDQVTTHAVPVPGRRCPSPRPLPGRGGPAPSSVTLASWPRWAGRSSGSRSRGVRSSSASAPSASPLGLDRARARLRDLRQLAHAASRVLSRRTSDVLLPLPPRPRRERRILGERAGTPGAATPPCSGSSTPWSSRRSCWSATRWAARSAWRPRTWRRTASTGSCSRRRRAACTTSRWSVPFTQLFPCSCPREDPRQGPRRVPGLRAVRSGARGRDVQRAHQRASRRRSASCGMPRCPRSPSSAPATRPTPPPYRVREIARRAPEHATLAVIEGAAHAMNWSHPGEVGTVVVARGSTAERSRTTRMSPASHRSWRSGAKTRDPSACGNSPPLNRPIRGRTPAAIPPTDLPAGGTPIVVPQSRRSRRRAARLAVRRATLRDPNTATSSNSTTDRPGQVDTDAVSKIVQTPQPPPPRPARSR